MPQSAIQRPEFWQALPEGIQSGSGGSLSVNVLDWFGIPFEKIVPDREPLLDRFEDPPRKPRAIYKMQMTRSAAADIYYAMAATLQSQSQFEQLREKIAAFSALPPDWDSYGAAAIAPTAIFKALMLLGYLERKQLLPDYVLPTSDESIFIRFADQIQIEEWEFFSTGEVGRLVIDAYGRETYSDVSLDELRTTVWTN